MSVEETQQPSFTVTAGGLPPPLTVSRPAPERDLHPSSPNSSASLANRWESSQRVCTNVDIADREYESLQRWTTTQQELNADGNGERNGEEGKVEDEEEEDELDTEEEDVGTGGEVTSAIAVDAQEATGLSPQPQQDPMSDVEVPDPTPMNARRESEGDNGSSPADSSPSAPEKQNTTGERVATPSRVAAARTPLKMKTTPKSHKPVTSFSPLKQSEFAVSPSPKRQRLSRSNARPRPEQDSFGEDAPLPRKPPAEQFARFMATSIAASATVPEEAGAEDHDEVTGLEVMDWNASAMKAVETPAATTEGDDTSAQPETVANPQDPSDPSQASQSVPHDDRESISPPTQESVTEKWLNLPSSSREHKNEAEVAEPDQHTRRSGRFGDMDGDDSSQGILGDALFSQHDEPESQHSVHSATFVATQSAPLNDIQPSSPPPSPPARQIPRSRTLGSIPDRATLSDHTATISSHGTSGERHGQTQEATQLLTESERQPDLPARKADEGTPTVAPSRLLPASRARRAAINPGSATRLAEMNGADVTLTSNPNTIAAPQAQQAKRQATMGPPLALEETYTNTQIDEDEPGVEIAQQHPAPAMPSSPPSSSPLGRPEDLPTAYEPQSLEPTYVDPTLTSLPEPTPHRPSPKRYGKKPAQAERDPVAASTSIASGLATPPPSAGPSRSPDEAEIRQDVKQPMPSTDPAGVVHTSAARILKTGRVAKRRRRDSSASLSDSSSSEEELDPLDESYRPASKAGGQMKTPKTAAPLKRLKANSNARSTSRQTSVSTRDPVDSPLSDPAPPPDQPPRILAWWHQSWYIGRIRGVKNGKYDIEFEDGDSSLVLRDRIRQGILRVGDRVKDAMQKGSEFEVAEDWTGNGDAIKVIGRADISLRNIVIRDKIVKSHFGDRLVDPQDLGYDDDDIAPVARPPPVHQRPSAGSDVFAGMIFFVTAAVTTRARPRNHQKSVGELIIQHDGKFVESWADLFDLPQSGFGSTLASTAAPFLLQETQQSALTQKVLVSLAKGIPCLSVAFIEDAIADPSTDWRSYLVDSGFSEKLRQNCSQLVDTEWGSTGWNAATAQAMRRPFIGKRFVFLKPLEKRYEYTKLILICLHAAGASRVDVVPHLGGQHDVGDADYILVEDRDSKGSRPAWVSTSERACNIQWLKQCLVMGAALKPAMMAHPPEAQK